MLKLPTKSAKVAEEKEEEEEEEEHFRKRLILQLFPGHPCSSTT